MLKRCFPRIGAGALALVLLSGATSQAQMIAWTQETGGLYAGPLYDLTPALYFVPTSVAVSPMTYVAFYPPLYSTRAPVAAPVASPPIVPLLEVPSSQQEATIEVRAPADAVLRFDGHRTSQTGTQRTFTTPPLPAGQGYSYEVEATFAQNGKTVTQRQRVQVQPGGRSVLIFPVAK